MGLVLAGVVSAVLWLTDVEWFEAALQVRISEAEPFVVSPEVQSPRYERLIATR